MGLNSRVPDGRDGKVTEEAEGVWQPHGGSNSVNRPDPQSSQGLDHQPKNTHGATHSAGHICGRGWPCWTSVGAEALKPKGVQCPSVSINIPQINHQLPQTILCRPELKQTQLIHRPSRLEDTEEHPDDCTQGTYSWPGIQMFWNFLNMCQVSNQSCHGICA